MNKREYIYQTMDFKNIPITIQVYKDGDMYSAESPELKVFSSGKTIKEAFKMGREACSLFLETAKEMGTLKSILEEEGILDPESGSLRKVVTEKQLQFSV